MDDKKSIDSIENPSKAVEISSATGITQSNAALPQKPDTTDTECVSATIDTCFSQDKQDAALVLTQSSADEEFSLRVQSSDDDDEKIEETLKNTKKSETLFSDIESSDDSMVYASRSKKEMKRSQGKASISGVFNSEQSEVKTSQSEFELVESEEEFFEDPPLAEGTETKELSKEENVDEKVVEPSESNHDIEEAVANETPEVDKSRESIQKDSDKIESSNENDQISSEIATTPLLEDESEEIENKVAKGSPKPIASSSSPLLDDCSDNLPDLNETEQKKNDDVDEKMTTERPQPSDKSGSELLSSENLESEDSSAVVQSDAIESNVDVDVEMENKEPNSDEHADKSKKTQVEETMDIDDVSLEATEQSKMDSKENDSQNKVDENLERNSSENLVEKEQDDKIVATENDSMRKTSEKESSEISETNENDEIISTPDIDKLTIEEPSETQSEQTKTGGSVSDSAEGEMVSREQPNNVEELQKEVSDQVKNPQPNNEELETPIDIALKSDSEDESPKETNEPKEATYEFTKPCEDIEEKEEDIMESEEKVESSQEIPKISENLSESDDKEFEYDEPKTSLIQKTSEEEDNLKKSDEKTPLSEAKESPSENPEIGMQVLEDKVIEVAAFVESLSSQVIEAAQDSSKSAPVVTLSEVIEIDDDDDEPQNPRKITDTDKTIEDEPPKVTENSEINTTVTPMDIDEELSTKTPAQPVQEEINKVVVVEQEQHKVDQEAPVVKINYEGVKNSQESASPALQVLEDDDDGLLMIDTSHKEENELENNMDNETATSAPTTDSSSDGSLEVFYDKECVNYDCKRDTKNYYRATGFALNYFKVSKKRSKLQFVCEDCYDRALGSYEELCKTLKQKQPLLHGTTFKCQEFVEIIDSSDEEESDAGPDKGKDENALPKDSIDMLEAELEGAIRKVMHNVEIQNQLSWTKQILQQRLTNLQEDSDLITEQLRSLQRKADHMHNSLYQCPKIKLRQLTPLDLNSGRTYNPDAENNSAMKFVPTVPPAGEIIRQPIRVNEQYYAVKTKAIASWVPCKVIEEVDGYPAGYMPTKTYKIKFTKMAKYPMFKTVYAKHMAYYDPPAVRLPIGSRVIAYFDATILSRGKEKMLIPSAFYPGIIAEPLKQSNKFRYLVFYDDGYFQYVSHKDVRLVCQASENVWEDVHHQSREFIHNYLTQYAVNRPMVQTQKGQSMLVDYNGKWIYARVIDVDCSLVQMMFEGQSRSEWIYRGSTRLGPVYKESNNLAQKNTLNATRRRTEPFIRYMNEDDSSSQTEHQSNQHPQAKATATASGSGEIRSVARKSVSRVDNSNNNNIASVLNSAAPQQPIPTVRHLNNSTIFVDDDNKPKGKVVYYTARKNLPPRNYVPHICNPSCPFNITHNLTFYSPLAKPLLSGWERQIFRQKSKKFIVYRGPCGKRLRNIEELHRYLRVTDNELNVDNFDFSPDTNCLAEYVLEKCLVNKKDISCGKEKMPIPCVNYYDESMPPACEYSAVRIPTEGVPLNLDEEFLCGCDCVDDCSDKTKCACWQLTYAGAKYGMPSVPTEMVGYQYKRLYEHVPTGIYECNSRCKCKANCVNRVVQQPLQSKLQVFKTSNRGWGLRCINDVPRGSFICVYAGQMLTEQVANEGGLDAGDEYFAELDYIEVAEQIKEGYESDVIEPEEDADLYNPERDDDDVDFRTSALSLKDKEFNTRSRTRKGNKNSTDGEFDSQERQVISFEPNKTMDTSNEPNEKPTIRKLFGKDESCYVMDAKVRGNLGRYFNHSCSPNLFVQNVFVDTHDLRFPWVAFFASTHIRAGTELTWNYNYEVGVVPGKVLYCQCGAPNCRQRLL